jgi:hypothetical protein
MGGGPGRPDSYCYGRKLLERVGWELFLGGDGSGGERWEPISWVRVAGDQVLLTVADGTTYRAGYTDAVRCRRPPGPGRSGSAPD